jgi:uncharacterized protein (DUF1697 family)
MATHVALLRGVNVGGVKVLMADLRAVVSSLGHAGVTTYIQSGNVLFTAAEPDTDVLERGLEAAIAQSLGVRTRVIVLTRDSLARAISDNPYPAEPELRFVHGVFLPGDPEPGTAERVAQACRQAAEQGSADEAVLLGRTLYLHTPDGFGRSVLANELLAKRSSPVAAGTARNWATVTKLLALCDG